MQIASSPVPQREIAVAHQAYAEITNAYNALSKLTASGSRAPLHSTASAAFQHAQRGVELLGDIAHDREGDIAWDSLVYVTEGQGLLDSVLTDRQATRADYRAAADEANGYFESALENLSNGYDLRF